MSAGCMTWKDIDRFERLLNAWGFGGMLENSDAFARDEKRLSAFLVGHSTDEYDDYAFISKHMDDYYDYLYDNEEHLDAYTYEMAHGCGYDPARAGATVVRY